MLYLFYHLYLLYTFVLFRCLIYVFVLFQSLLQQYMVVKADNFSYSFLVALFLVSLASYH